MELQLWPKTFELNKNISSRNLKPPTRRINQAPVSGDLWPLQMSTTMGIKMPQHSQHQPSGNDSKWSTFWLFNIAMENGPFIDDVPIKTSIYKVFSMAMLNNQRVPPKIIWKVDHKKSEFLMGHGAMIHHDHWNWGNPPLQLASSVVCNTTSECNGVISCFWYVVVLWKAM